MEVFFYSQKSSVHVVFLVLNEPVSNLQVNPFVFSCFCEPVKKQGQD